MPQNDYSWAVSLPDRLLNPPVLATLDQLTSYTDHTGELGKFLGNGKSKGAVYKGASAIMQIGKKIRVDEVENRNSSHRQDRVDRLYQEVLEYVQLGGEQSPSQLMTIKGINPTILLKIYNRYWKSSGFPLMVPSESYLDELLGIDGVALDNNSTLRSAVSLLFLLYSHLSDGARKWLIEKIGLRIQAMATSGNYSKTFHSWVAAVSLLFTTNPSISLAEDYNKQDDMSFPLYAAQLRIPERSSLFTAIRLESLCQKLKSLPHSIESPSDKSIVKQVFAAKDEHVDQQWTVAAKCLHILIERSSSELGGMPTDDWSDLIVDMACHPDPNLSGQSFSRYWGWANSKQLDVARMAFVRRDLEVIFEYLRQAAQQGQIGGHMVAPRINFYKALLRNRLIRDTRLFLGTNVHRSLRYNMKKDQFWDLHNDPDRDLCILALKLADGVNLTTGTKSFPMRFYADTSPLFKNLWDRFSPSRKHPQFSRHDFMHDRPDCIRKIVSGNWKRAVIQDILPDPFLGRVDWRHYDL